MNENVSGNWWIKTFNIKINQKSIEIHQNFTKFHWKLTSQIKINQNSTKINQKSTEIHQNSTKFHWKLTFQSKINQKSTENWHPLSKSTKTPPKSAEIHQKSTKFHRISALLIEIHRNPPNFTLKPHHFCKSITWRTAEISSASFQQGVNEVHFRSTPVHVA